MTIGNKATSNIQRVLVGDYGTMITITLDNVEKDKVATIEWIRAYNASEPVPTGYIDITDFSVVDGILNITLPPIPRGTYNLEIKDEDGRFYPAEGKLRLEMLPSTYDAKEYVFTVYYEQVLDDVEQMVAQYIIDNPDGFKGEKGEKGDTVTVPPKIYTRAEYDALPTKSADTLYIVKEVE